MNAPTPSDAISLLTQRERAGVFASDEETARLVFNAAPGRGYHVVRIDFGHVANKDGVLDAFARALRFPEWYGHNWDALADCLSDLSWCESDGYVLLLRQLERLEQISPECRAQLLEILTDTCAYWQREGHPFWVFVIGEAGDLQRVSAQA